MQTPRNAGVIVGPREFIVCVVDDHDLSTKLLHQLQVRFGAIYGIVVSASDSFLDDLAELDRKGALVAVVIADQVRDSARAIEVLEAVDHRYPNTNKVLLVENSELGAVATSIRRIHLNYYLSKPWDEIALGLVVANLLRQFHLTQENRMLVENLSAKNRVLLEMNRELEAKVHERTRALAEANVRLSQLAVTDGLTGLFNHRHFYERLSLEIERSQRSQRPLSLLLIDVDHFKDYNDRYGHPAGDVFLRQLGEVLTSRRRSSDVVARYGGEEFAVILVDVDKIAAAKLAEKIREDVYSHDFSPPDQQSQTRLTISVGVATYPNDARDIASLVQAADSALYSAKGSGRNRVALAT
jgi:diguanylate cyclase (GGDEF)-like protein